MQKSCLADGVETILEEGDGTINNPWIREHTAAPTVVGTQSEVRRA
jgi:hypothetical protein